MWLSERGTISITVTTEEKHCGELLLSCSAKDIQTVLLR